MKRDVSILLRVTEDERAVFEQVKTARGHATMSELLRQLVREAAAGLKAAKQPQAKK